MTEWFREWSASAVGSDEGPSTCNLRRILVPAYALVITLNLW